MHLEMIKIPDKDEIAITIYAEPLKVIGIEGVYIEVEWERRRWKMRLPSMYASIFDEGLDEYTYSAFLGHLNRLLKLVGKYEE